ncbi:MAG: hypothetical protein M0Z79_02870 [Nitrospiraceae bacterium]|nr:hypothetical protein [Nitrospiraceae bacterium]
MKTAAIFLAVAILFSPLSLSGAVDQKAAQPAKQPELKQIKPKKPVKIKLRRTAKDDYNWELTGDDADEIIRTDRKLRRLLNVQ